MVQALHVRLLGPVVASHEGHPLELGPPQQRALFAALAARANQPVSRDEIVDAVWGTNAPATVDSSIYTYVARLRRGLEPARRLRAPSRLLQNDSSGYMLSLEPGSIDLPHFERQVERARQLQRTSSWQQALIELDAALSLWQGTAFGGVVGPFADAERGRLEELRIEAVEARAEILLELDRHAEVIGELYGLARRHPLRERPRHLLMLAHYRSGRQADALAEFRDLRRVLVEELGLEPGGELRRCHELILHGEPVVSQPENPDTPPVQVLWATPAQLPRDVPAFTGRARELRRLRTLVAEAEGSGEAAVILINGGPGAGKTALAVHLAHELAAQYPDGQLHVDLSGFTGDRAPLSSYEALGQLLSSLGQAPVERGRRAGTYRSLMAGRRLLLLLDNAESAAQCRSLLPGTPSSLVIVTSRNRLSGLVARDGARRVTVGTIPYGDAATLARRLMGDHADPALVDTLVESCSGLPVALRIAAERVLTGAHGTFSGPGELLKAVHADDDESTSLRALFSWSYRALSDDAARMFRALGGENSLEVDLSHAAATAGVTHECARLAMDRLVSAHLVERAGEGRFRLHGLMHAYAAEVAATS